jgi:hypothetical protein
MTVNNALHFHSDMDRLYLPREDGRQLLQARQIVEEEKRALKD